MKLRVRLQKAAAVCLIAGPTEKSEDLICAFLPAAGFKYTKKQE